MNVPERYTESMRAFNFGPIAISSGDTRQLPEGWQAESKFPMHDRYLFTVFTPTYNRAQTLPRVYESLQRQTFRDFEWLIVDDGSTDNTRELIARWQAESNFPIRYIFQANQGKPAAFNHGVQEARGELLLTLDSDDGCVPEALERFKYHWDSIPAQDKDKFSAVTVLCKDQNGNLVGDKFPRDVMDSDTIEVTFKHRVTGEKWGFQRTDVLKKFPFPAVPNAKFISESVVWYALSRKYKTRYVNEALRIYHVHDGAEDHLSTLSSSVLSGRAYLHRYVLNEMIDWLFRTPRSLFRSAINFSRYSFGLGIGPLSQLKELRSTTARVLVAASMPVGFLMSLRDQRKV
jgi:glycosyltransferase involved in cell wall biosynthesis